MKTVAGETYLQEQNTTPNTKQGLLTRSHEQPKANPHSTNQNQTNPNHRRDRRVGLWSQCKAQPLT